MRIVLLLLPFLPGVLFTQNLRLDWQKSFGSAATFHAVIEATNGYLVAVGETTAKTSGGSDGLLVVADHSTGQVIANLQLGGHKDDVLYAVAQTFDGRFLLAGTTASAGKGGKDAWLVLVNERGQKIRETTFGTPGRDECRKILLLPDGAALLAGYQNDRKNGDIWLARVDDMKISWEKNLGASEFETLSGLAMASDGSIAFCGNTGKKAGAGAGDVYLAAVNSKGDLQWKKWFGEGGWEEALDLIATRDGGFALAGLTKSNGAGDLDCWLIKTARDGFRQWDKTFGGKDADVANAVAQTDDDGYLIAGSTKSHRSGARFSDAFFVQASPGGDRVEEQHLGQDRDDWYTAVCALHNGSLVMSGIFDGDEASLLRFSDIRTTPSAMTGTRDAVSVGLSDITLHTPDGTLTPGEHSYLAFRISNTTDIDLTDLRVTVDNPGGNGDLSVWNVNYLGSVRKGKEAAVRIPVEAGTSLTPGNQRLNIILSSGEKSLKSVEKTIALRQPQPPALLLAGYQFEASGSSDEVTLNVQIENSGDSSAQGAEVRFILPQGLRATGAAQQPMGVIDAHSRREARLIFVKTPQCTAAVAGIVCTVLENDREKVRKTLEWQTGAGKASLLANGPILIWTDPAPHETGTNKVRMTAEYFEFKMTVVSSKTLDTRNFKMKINGAETEGSKFNEEDLSPPRMENTQYTYTYKNKIKLQQGNNQVVVVVDNQESDPLEVDFAPQRANLFLLAIGPKHEDLQYTAKDAADFAQAFQQQGGEGKLFNQVITTVLTTPEKTDLTGIKQAVYDLAYQWDDKQIKPNDVLIVFISSHGKIVDNRFKLLQSGYNPKYERLTVDFKTDILEVLNNINCKKLVLLDACHSGGAKEGYGGLSQAVVDLAKAQPGISTLTSCGSTEKSYEDKFWENGAFTEALLEAFAGAACEDAAGAFRADANGDRVLRLGELYDFLRRRVPALVQSKIPNAPTTQTPFMPEEQLDKDLPLYFLGGN